MTLTQQLQNLILETIGEDETSTAQLREEYAFYNSALQDLREKVPALVEKINNKILNEITDIFINADQREDRVELSDIEKLLQ